MKNSLFSFRLCWVLLGSLGILQPFSKATAQAIQLTAYDAVGNSSNVSPNATVAGIPTSAAYTIELDYPFLQTPNSGQALKRSIWVNGPTFDPESASRVLLDTLRHYVLLHPKMQDNLSQNSQSFAAQLLNPHLQPRDETRVADNQGLPNEQAIAQGFVAAISSQLATKYNANTTPASASAGLGLSSSSSRNSLSGQRPHYTMNGLSDFPRFLRPGTVLLFPFQQLNWLKYAPTVESKGYTREFANTTNFPSPPEEVPKKSPPAADKNLAESYEPTLSLEERTQTLLTAVADFKELEAELESAYQADYWLDPKADLTTRNSLVKKVFSVDFVSARQIADQPQVFQAEINAILKDAADAVVLAKAMKTSAEKKTAVQNATALQATLTEKLKPATGYLAPYLVASSAQQTRLATLGTALVQLRNVLKPRVATPLLLPDEKDEADVTIEYKLRTDYKPPAGTTPNTLAKQEFTILLLPRFRITGSIGPYYCGLVDRRFSFVSDSMEYTNAAGKKAYLSRKRIERDNAEEWFTSVGASALIHFEYRYKPSFGMGAALGLGVQNDGPRLLFGPSVLIGNTQRAAISFGVATGRVTRLASGYEEGHDHLIKDPGTSQVPTRIVNAASWFVALSYNLGSTRK